MNLIYIRGVGPYGHSLSSEIPNFLSNLIDLRLGSSSHYDVRSFLGE